MQHQRQSARRHRPLCPLTGKQRFRDHHEATQALTGMRRRRAAAERDCVPTRRHEVRAFPCACRGFHLTSAPASHESH